MGSLRNGVDQTEENKTSPMVEIAATLALMGAGDAIMLYAYGYNRTEMKTKDGEIKKEGERERKAEREDQEKRPLDVDFKHHKHRHPLNEVDGDQKFSCGSCERSGIGRRYRCCVAGCGFEMHTVCASSPIMMVRDDFQPEVMPESLETFAHREHGDCVKKVYRKVEVFECGHCNNVGKGFRYRCEYQGCQCTLHPICAKSPTRINTFMHPEHELELITRPFFAKCSACNRGRKSHIHNRVYACKSCKFYLHPTCSLWPQYLFHELHPKLHPLQLKVSPSSSSSSFTCGYCKEKGKDIVMYRCESCHESYHPLCLMRFSLNANADGKPDVAFKKDLAEQSEFHVEFAAIDRIGLIG